MDWLEEFKKEAIDAGVLTLDENETVSETIRMESGGEQPERFLSTECTGTCSYTCETYSSCNRCYH